MPAFYETNPICMGASGLPKAVQSLSFTGGYELVLATRVLPNEPILVGRASNLPRPSQALSFTARHKSALAMRDVCQTNPFCAALQEDEDHARSSTAARTEGSVIVRVL